MADDYSYMTADPYLYSLLKQFSKELKKNMTPAESILWSFLKGNGLGKPFRRQHIIGEFIADFVCLPRKIIIELDGGYHNLPQQQISDKERTKWLEDKGFTVIRFTNEEVIGDKFNVINKIEKFINNE